MYHWDVFCTCLLGILILSDWISSGSYFASSFLTMDGFSFKNAQSFVERQMDVFLSENQLLPQNFYSSIFSFSDLWDFIPKEKMRPIQSVAESVIAENMLIPDAVLLEAPMGEGKTEAALYMALQLAKSWGKDGFYVALPTAATSNQMYSRINEMLAKLNVSKAKLMHSMAWAMDDNQINGFTGKDSVLWTAPMRRGLIAPFSVGTVDQVMLAVMHVKYGVLRLIGLASKVLVIDEIHSYDVYMDEILISLLQWCKELHIPVIMLSATLPMAKKKKFASCYTASPLTLSHSSYPSFTLFFDDAQPKMIPVPAGRVPLRLGLRIKPWFDDVEAIVSDVAGKINSIGGCYCIIRNTVKDAQSTYSCFKELFPDIPVVLFHARFTARRRKALEELCISLVGKNAKERPAKFVLVATQVVEQSLDLDFDGLFTDICPIDLLLQRAGRIWRHDTTSRPNGLVSEITVFIADKNVTYPVYDEIIMDMTSMVLLEIKSITIPSDIPLLVGKVYDDAIQQKQDMEKWLPYQFSNVSKQKCAQQECFQCDERIFSMDEFNENVFDDVDSSIIACASTRLGKKSVVVAFIENRNLFEKIRDGVFDRQDAKQVLLESTRIQYKKLIDVLEANKIDHPNVVFGNGLLYGVYVLLADKGHCRIDVFDVCMDDEIGMVVKEI